MIRILIADDHAIVRKGLRQILSETSDIVIADEAGSGQEALEKGLENDYDIVVLDISMPDRNGLDILKQLKVEKPGLPVLVLSMHPEEQYAIRALREGAFGYLTKESAPGELIRAIRKISEGRKYVSSSLAEKLATRLKPDADKPPHESLSNREFQVMLLLANGKTVKEAAGEMHLSAKTVSTYRARIMAKMNMKNNAELIRYAIKNGLV
ncbi:MAG: response regulator [Candidatus Glassbacteria bacterium]